MLKNELIKHLRDIAYKNPVIVFDGRCASGKTTVAKILEDAGYKTVHTDHFFLPPELRSAQRLSTPGGNIHFERFKEQVIEPLLNRNDIAYDIFDCSLMSFSGKVVIPKNTPVIIEGAYSLHPQLGKYYDEAYFFDISAEEQLARLAQRCAEKLQVFKDKWIPMEEKYIKYFNINQPDKTITVFQDPSITDK